MSKIFIFSLLLAWIPLSPLLSQPVEWRVEDGGNGHFYELISTPAGFTWTQAERDARARSFQGMPGYLVTVTSEEEHRFLESHWELWAIWIGLSDRRIEGVYEWVTGEPFQYSRWGDNEPNNAGNEDFISYTASPGFWNDFKDQRTVNARPFTYIVEYDLDGPLPPDCDGDEIPDSVELLRGEEEDCNQNSIPDSCEIASGEVDDVDGNGIPDDCSGSCPGAEFPVTRRIDFERPELPPFLETGGYTQEDSGSQGFVSDLAIQHVDGEIRIHGTGSVDTMLVDEQNSGWFGRSLYFSEDLEFFEDASVETTVRLLSHAFGNGAGAGYEFCLFIEFDDDNRIYLSYRHERSGGREMVLGFDDRDDDSRRGDRFSFPDSTPVRIRLQFDPVTRIATGHVEGQEVVRRTYAGGTGPARFGLAATVRVPGDQLDVRFDDLEISGVCAGDLLDFPDCNENGVDDALEIESGSAPDCNSNGIPDRCDIELGNESDDNSDGVPDSCQLPTFRRGDSNGDGEVDLSDSLQLLRVLYLGARPLECPDSADSNDDGALDTGDVMHAMNVLFLGVGDFPPPASGGCGVDPTEDDLSICSTRPDCSP